MGSTTMDGGIAVVGERGNGISEITTKHYFYCPPYCDNIKRVKGWLGALHVKIGGTDNPSFVWRLVERIIEESKGYETSE